MKIPTSHHSQRSGFHICDILELNDKSNKENSSGGGGSGTSSSRKKDSIHHCDDTDKSDEVTTKNNNNNNNNNDSGGGGGTSDSKLAEDDTKSEKSLDGHLTAATEDEDVHVPSAAAPVTTMTPQQIRLTSRFNGGHQAQQIFAESFHNYPAAAMFHQAATGGRPWYQNCDRNIGEYIVDGHVLFTSIKS